METSFQKFDIKSPGGLRLELTNFGARIMSLFVPFSDGSVRNVCLGFSDPASFYLAEEQYFGAIVGRYCNRIAGAKFELEGKTYKLAKNIGDNNLHGGVEGFHRKFWLGKQVANNAVEFRLDSQDGDEGFPGNLEAYVMYAIVENELHISFRAMTDKVTHVNLTPHPYFNLKGEGNGSVLSHELMINADNYTPVNKEVVPTGEYKEVHDTPFDFRKFRKIGDAIDSDHDQIKIGNGYDHNFVLRKGVTKNVELAAVIQEPESGMMLQLFTTEPGLQFYTANWLSGNDSGYSGRPYLAREAFCLEPQHFPNSPNEPDFPRTALFPGERYESRTVFKFFK